MTNETRFFYGTPVTLESAGAVITNNALAQADDASYDLVANGGGYPDAVFVLACAFATAPTEGSTIALYARPLDVDGTSDTEVPEAARPTEFIGTFVLNNVTTTQYIRCVGTDLPQKADYYLHNNGSGQSMSSGWTLKVTPRTYGPAA